MRLFAAAAIVALAQPPAQEQQPTFKSGVELVTVDVQVVDKKGNPVDNLLMAQFDVTIDGKRRRVVSSQMIESATGLPRLAAAGAPASTTVSNTRPGNVYVLAVDQGSFRAVNAPSVVYAVREFLKRVHANDYVGVISYPAPGVRIDPTRDRSVINEAVGRLVGFSAMRSTQRYDFSPSEAIDVSAGDAQARAAVMSRNNCSDVSCMRQIEMEMQDLIGTLEMQGFKSLSGLRDVVGSIKGIDGRKTLVVISAGIPAGDRTGGRVYMRNEAVQVGRDAVAAGIVLYTLHINTAFLDQYSPDAPSARRSPMRDSNVFARGLDTFNGYAGGTFFEINTGADFAIDRVVRETAAYYLLGVEVDDVDRDGKTHLIQVKVKQRDTSVRSRGSVVIPKRAS